MNVNLLIFVFAAGSAVTGPVHHLRGIVSAVEGNRVAIATSHGREIVMLGPATTYAGVASATVGDIKDGTFIGTANVPAPGGNRALEVVVFPPALKGTGEGNYPWDLPAAGNAMSAMTNGTVVAPASSAMTNATVSRVAGDAVKTVTLQYHGGTKVVTIPPSAPIVRIVPASKALIVVGAHVFVAKNGTSTRVIVGEGGVVPPM